MGYGGLGLKPPWRNGHKTRTPGTPAQTLGDTMTFQSFQCWVTGSPSDLLIVVSRGGCGIEAEEQALTTLAPSLPPPLSRTICFYSRVTFLFRTLHTTTSTSLLPPQGQHTVCQEAILDSIQSTQVLSQTLCSGSQLYVHDHPLDQAVPESRDWYVLHTSSPSQPRRSLHLALSI